MLYFSFSAALKINNTDHVFRTELNLARLVFCYTQPNSCIAFVSTCYEHALENLTFPAKRHLYINSTSGSSKQTQSFSYVNCQIALYLNSWQPLYEQHCTLCKVNMTLV